ncbi:hypothetical protein CLV47_109133 [Antricoccus suffuscus]|uniref:Glycine/sarcosine/betaine reductase selenoprotein B n=1 Tax=Antricoccus suffuscus TaxID=1629062 RepID=A0A2T0ZYZ9_9ACTN|nr:glycine reductase [Antricoccus suffuscus]PRZ41586.1 hypothetical protein CLV47_109133 [Antricoccus suffuscus]
MADSEHRTPLTDTTEFAPEWTAPVPYMQRTRDWYLALGYGNPYRWAHYAEVPFASLAKPLAESRLALITTAAPYQEGKGDQGPGAPYNAAAKFYEVYSGRTDEDHDLRISHVAIDRTHTTAADSGTYFPLPALRDAVTAGRIGALTERFHGAPTNRSQRRTLEVDCPRLLELCRDDGADAAVLVPNCPVCHQTLSLVARYLESNGIPTVVMGAAKDIVEYAGVPRFAFSDFPLGNAAGRPGDPRSQADTLEFALRVLESAPGPRTTVQNPLAWVGPDDWRMDYCNVDRVSPEELARLRAENDAIKETARAVRESTIKT